MSPLIKKNQFDQFINYQLARASFSVALNIAEGSGKFSDADRRNFYVISRASVFECVAIFDMLKYDEMISEEICHRFVADAEELSKILFAMISNLSK